MYFQNQLSQALVRSLSREDTRQYISEANLPCMHKIVLQTPKNMSLTELSTKLYEEAAKDASVPPHYLWIEQPENIPTCLAIAPNRKPTVCDMSDFANAGTDKNIEKMYIAT